MNRGMDRSTDPTTQDRMKHFIAVYRQMLTDVRLDPACDYVWPVSELPTVLDKMEASIKAGTFNKDSVSFRRTCKLLAIPHTYKGIFKYIGLE